MTKSVWSIKNNETPLSELSDEQAGALFNHWRNGGVIEYLQYVRLGTWTRISPKWVGRVVYRAK
ncbi:hypothetical protein NVP1083O_59 [Vibrio phage 1.083.O._10N.286.52.B9]|nr:hypothetical protein NVP1083O_59 [Vibrio phage 1.083.O._10N.286.52.B9]